MNSKCVKIVFMFIILFSTSSMVFAETPSFVGKVYYVPYIFKIAITDTQFKYINLYQEAGRIDEMPTTLPHSMVGNYKIENRFGYTVLHVSFAEESRDIIVFYQGTQLVLYDTTLEISIWAQEINTDGYGLFYLKPVSASSYLTETIQGKMISYGPENLRNRDLTLPWVEGVPDQGIGETISFTGLQASHIIIQNGFFAPKNLSLYGKNNRLKKVLIKGFDENGNFIYTVERNVEDIPNFQILVLPQISYGIELEIIDVYKGSTYNDTCLAGVFKDGLITDYDWGRLERP